MYLVVFNDGDTCLASTIGIAEGIKCVEINTTDIIATSGEGVGSDLLKFTKMGRAALVPLHHVRSITVDFSPESAEQKS